MNDLLISLVNRCLPYTKEGRVASYIPELKKADPNRLGVCLLDNAGGVYSAADCDCLFTMQSIVKPIIFLLALKDNGEERVRSLVGMEATGKPFDAFNYSDQALTRENINPMINTGAIALCDILYGDTIDERFDRLLSFARDLTGNPRLCVNEDVYRSERETGHKNRALAHMLKAYGMLSGDVNDVLDIYFRACSIEVNCHDLARMALLLANHGRNAEGKQLVLPEYCRMANAVMSTSGMYDGSGEFAFDVGVPAKSGVGGGIMAVVPGRMGIGIFSPALDKKGNSLAGRKLLSLLSRELELSIF